MNGHIRPDRLHDYVADLLCREERAEVEGHLVVCDQCARAVGALRDRAPTDAPPVSGAPGNDDATA